MRSSYRYDPKGQIIELLHEDREGVLDRYQYQYDLSGNKTGITKERRGLKEESGDYRYGYDAIGRLESVMKDGDPLRCYSYDAFGNRINLLEGRKTTAYTYNALNQLTEKSIRGAEYPTTENYSYDKRGNLIQTLENGTIKNQYIYGAINRLEKAVNGKGEAASYQYNGLGYRVGKQEGRTADIHRWGDSLDPLNQLEEQKLDPVKDIRYTIDLTREYHNLLEKMECREQKDSVQNHTQTYLWDGNVAGFYGENADTPQYYLQDELGSPVRIEGVDGNLVQSYGYDEFGCGLYRNQGEVQPFGYTGYQHDAVAGTYFAQAREYVSGHGRFAEVDRIKGDIALPFTLDCYGYCWGNPIKWVDVNGKEPNDSEYTGVVYLNVESGAYTMGHAAILLVRENGKGDLYSYVGTPSPTVIAGYNDAYVNYAYDVDISTVIKKDNKNEKGYLFSVITRTQEDNADPYNRGIFIPITNSQGEDIRKAAEVTKKAVNGTGKDEKDYNLFFNNCDQNARSWIKAGGIEVDKGGFWWLLFGVTGYAVENIRPNSIYDRVTRDIEKGNREGWRYGELSELFEEMGCNE